MKHDVRLSRVSVVLGVWNQFVLNWPSNTSVLRGGTDCVDEGHFGETLVPQALRSRTLH